MKTKLKKHEGIMKLHEAKRYVSAPDPEADAEEYIQNLYLDALERGIIPPDTSIERFRKELHDFDYGYRRKQTPTRFAKVEKPAVYDSNKPVTLQDYLKWGMTIGNLDEQSLESLKFMLDKLKEQK